MPTSAVPPLPLQFAPFSSQVPSSFWSSLAKVKIDRLQLSQDSIPVVAHYTTGRSVVDRTSGDVVPLPVGLHLDSEVLKTGESSQSQEASSVELRGQLKNFNTVEDFKNADKGSIETDKDPLARLNNFLVLSYADLKKFKFIYWFAYPALLAKPGWQVHSEWKTIDEVYSEEQVRIRRLGREGLLNDSIYLQLYRRLRKFHHLSQRCPHPMLASFSLTSQASNWGM
jgi:ubiquitin-like modifier-activating enzyme ATG7